MDKNKEIRTILSGNISVINGAYTARTSLWQAGFTGMINGSDSVGIFGLTRTARHYRSDSVDSTAFAAKQIFGKLGRSVFFRSEPELPACFLRSYLGNPVILTLVECADGICVEAYTARSLFSGLNLRRALNAFEKHMPENVQANMTGMEQEKNRKVPRVTKAQEKRRERKDRKKAEKLEKRAQRLNTKAQTINKRDEGRKR